VRQVVVVLLTRETVSPQTVSRIAQALREAVWQFHQADLDE